MISKFILLGLFIILITSLTSAIQIGISPAELKFEGNIGEEICNDIVLSSDQEQIFSGKDIWSNQNYLIRDITKYDLQANSVNIRINYPNNIKVNTTNKAEICIIGNNVGRNYGAIIYETNQSVAVGTWLITDLNNEKNYVITESNKTIVLESNKINNSKEKSRTASAIMLIFTTTMIMLIQILAVLKHKSKQ